MRLSKFIHRLLDLSKLCDDNPHVVIGDVLFEPAAAELQYVVETGSIECSNERRWLPAPDSQNDIAGKKVIQVLKIY